jgi:hypothetical protein
VQLIGRPDPNIPPQQNARWVQPQTVRVPGDLAATQNNSPLDQKFRHSGNPWKALPIALFLGFFMLVGCHVAFTNNQGLIINGIIRLGPTGATILFTALAILFAAAFILTAAVALQCFINPHSIEIRPDGIVFWNGWFTSKPTFVPFAAIQGVGHQQNVKGGPRVMVIAAGNKKYRIDEANLAGRETYNTILARIVAGQRRFAVSQSTACSAPPHENKPAPKPPPDDDSRYMPKEQGSS